MSDIRVGIKLTTDGSGKVTAEITQVKKGLEDTGKAAESAASKNKKAAADTRNAWNGVGDQINAAKKAFLAYISVQAAWSATKQITATADAWTNLNSRIRAVTGTQREFGQALADVSSIANQYKQDINEVGGAYSRFATAVQKLGMTQRDLRDILSATAAGLQLSGSSAGQAAGAMQQLGQALASPIVHAEELNSVFEGNLVLYNAIEKQLPNLVRQYGSLKNAVNEQALTNQDLAKAIKAASVELENQSKVMQTTVSGALTVFSNEFEKYIGNADQASESSRDLANGILMLSRNMETVMYLPAKIVLGWGLIFEAIGKATEKLQSFVELSTRFSLSDAFKSLFSPSPGGPPLTRAQQLEQAGVNAASPGSGNVGRDIMRGAQQYLGYNETGPKKQELIDFLNKYSGTVFKDIAGDVNAWCARFVSAVLQQNGIQNPQSAAARSYADWGQSVWKQGDGNKGLENLRPGDIAVFTRKGGAHVAFVDSIDAAKGALNVLGGNQSNSVSLSERSIQDLIAVRRAPGGEAFGVAKNPQLDALTLATKGLTDIQKMIVQKAMAAKLDPLTMLGLAQRESQFNPNASNKDARGLWQFTTGTGADYGLKTEADRKNVEKSTDAAMRMFKDLMTGLDGNLRHVLAAWNMGEKGVKRKLAEGKNPEDYTEGPHVQRILEYRQQWEAKLGGKLGSVMDVGDMKKNADAWKKLLDQQFDAYAQHLKKLESQRDNSNTVELSAQRVQMEKLEAQRAQIAQKDQQAISNAQGLGNVAAIDKAMQASRQHEEEYLKNKQSLLMQGMELEKKALEQSKAHIDQKIAYANKLKGNELEKIPGLQIDREKITAELQALANKRKEIEIGAATEIEKTRSEFEDKRRQTDKQAADDNAQAVAERRQMAEDEYRFFQQSMSLQLDRAKSLAESRKADIDLTLEQAKALASQADAARQAATEGKTGMDAIAQARQNVNAKLEDSLRLIDLEKTATLDKLRIDGDILASQRQLLEVYRAIAEQKRDRDKVLETEKQLNDVYSAQQSNIRARVQAEMDAAGAAAKARTAATGDIGDLGKKQIQEVADELLRLNKIWDNAVQAVEEYSKTFVAAFGQVGETLANVANIMANYERRQQRINSEADEAIRKSPGKKQEIDQKRYLDSLANTSDLMANMALTARKFTKEGSDGYKAMTIAAQSFAAISQSINLALGIQAVLKQLVDGDSYSALFRAIAVAAFVGSLGIAVAGIASGSGGGGQSRESAQDRRDKQLSGTVLGDSTAFSDSLANSLNIVAENSSADLDYSKGMLRALTNIEKLLGGASAAVAGGLMNMPNLFKLGKGWEFSDIGLSSVDKTLGQYFGGGGFQGAAWGEIVKEAADGTKRYKDIFTELNGTIKSQFTRVIMGIADSVRKAGEAFGLNASDFQAKMMNFVVSFGNVSFGDLKGDDLEKAIQQMFSKMSDEMAMAFMPGLQAFQQVGEGYMETMVRVSNGILVATGMLEQAGLQAINYQQITLKQGDIAAEIIRQSIVAFEGATSAIGRYIDGAVGSAEELMKVYQDLLIISDTAKLTGFNLNNLSNALIVTSGGVSRFLENLSTYQTDIMGGSDYARQMLTLTREFGKLGQAVPANNEAFVRLVDSIDTTTESGQKLYAQILALAGAFSKAQQEAAKLEELRAKYRPKDSMAEYRKQIDQVGIDFKQIREGVLAGLPGGANYIKRTQRIESLGNLKEDRQDELNIVKEDIAKLEAKGKLTAKEKQTLAGLRQQRKDLEAEIADTDKLISQINKLIEKNKNTPGLIAERNKLIEEQGNAIIQTLADIWDKMTAAINAAKETLISIQNDIFELNFTAGSPDIKKGMTNAKLVTARTAYDNYTGNDIEKLNKLASDLHSAIMANYQAEYDAIMAPKIALEKERDLAQKAHDEQIAALEKQLGVAKELFDAVKGIQEYAKSLRTSAAANLSPKKQLDAAKKNYDELLAKAQGGDVEAMRQITGASDAYLDAAKKYFGSGGKYGQIFDGIVSAMDKLGMTDAGDSQSIQDKIDQLNKDHEVYLRGIDDKIAALNIDQKVKDLQKNTADELQKLADNLGPRIDAIELQAKEDMKNLIAAATAGNVLNAAQLAALNKMLVSWGMDPIETVKKDLTPPPSGTGGTTIPGIPTLPIGGLIRPGVPTMPAYADGGFAQPGWALVGEEGPELVKFGSQAQVFAADATQRMLRDLASLQPVPSQAPRPINLEKMPPIIDDIRRPDPRPAKLSGNQDDVIAELRAMRAELKALVTTQSRANPAVIEQLANIERRLGYMERDAKLKPA